jgi:polar amino acid transport system permease protein
LVLVAITVIVSLAYAVQYYLGGPIRLPVVGRLLDLALNPQNTLLAVGGSDGVVRLYEVPGRISTAISTDAELAAEEPWPVRFARGHHAPVIEVAFTPDGSKLTTVSSDGVVIRWDLGAGQTRTLLAIRGEDLNDAKVSADGSLLATIANDRIVRIWDLTTGQALQTLGPGEDTRLAVALSPDGAVVAAGDGANVQVWDVQTGQAAGRLEGYCDDETRTTPEACQAADADWMGHDEEVTVLAFSPDGQILASGSADTTIVFWDLESSTVASPAAGHWAAVTTMVFSEDGDTLLSGGGDQKVRNLRVQSGRSTATYVGHLNTVNSVSFGPAPDVIFSAGDDGTMRVWETANQKIVHMEWSRHGFQATWGRVLATWMLISGLLGLACLWGLWKLRTWSHLLALAMYVIGPIIVLGLPLLEVISYPLTTAVKLQIAWPLIVLAVWYLLIDFVLMRDSMAVLYEAPRDASLSEQLVISQRTVKTRFGILTLAVWVALLVILFSFLRRFDLDVAFMGHFLPFIMGGATLTVLVSAASIAGAVILALLGALGRLSRNPIANGLSGFYISLIRGTPLLVQIFIWYLGLPRLGIVLDPIPAGILALSVNYGAYMTEIFRAGIQAIGKGQHEAAEALGMTRAQTFRRIVLPQAFRIVIPPIGNQFIAMMKDSSLVMVMGVWELTFRAQKIGRQNFRNLETFLIAAAFYWILTVIFQFLQGKLEDYMARGERR